MTEDQTVIGSTISKGEESLSSHIAEAHIGAVHRISRLLSSSLDLDQRLCDIVTVSMEAVDAAGGSILLHRAEDDRLVFGHVVGPNADVLAGYSFEVAGSIAGAVFRTGTPRVTNDAAHDPQHRGEIARSFGITVRNLVSLPLMYRGGKPVGVMQVVNKRLGDFTPEDLQVLEIVAAISGTAIENANLAREAQIAAVAHAVGDLSHDIKNKVTPIVVAVDTLAPMLDDAFREMDRAAADLPPEAAQSLAESTGFVREFAPETFDIVRDQVREVREYTKLIADALKGAATEPHLEVQDPVPILARQLDSLEPIARARGVALVRDFANARPFRFDRFLLERAVYNLVNNAIPETPEGGRIAVRLRPEGEQMLVEVVDTGCGMPANVLERILRGDAKSTKPGGTGLGTRIVYNAAAAHRGAFEGESREGAGTTFRLRLPLGT